MGQFCSSSPWLELLDPLLPINVLFVGLDNGGKTAVVDRLANCSSSSASSTTTPHSSSLRSSCRCLWRFVRGVGDDDVNCDACGSGCGCGNSAAADDDDDDDERTFMSRLTPTVGFRVSRFKLGCQCVLVFDMSGQVGRSVGS